MKLAYFIHASLFFALRVSLGSSAIINEHDCGIAFTSRESRIVGGEGSSPNEFPWLASIRFNGQHYCGGALLDRQWILTAAHCVSAYVPSNFLVRLGGHEARVSVGEEAWAEEIPLDRIVVHQNFSRPRPFANDIALIKLRRPVDYNQFIRPVCLPAAEDDLRADTYAGKSGLVVGWGWVRDSLNSPIRAKVLQKVSLPIIENETCEDWYRSQRRLVLVSPSQYCAGYESGGKDACRGDSGGPMLSVDERSGRYTAIGIVSAGIGCALPKMPGLYSRVSAFVPWIETHMST